MPRPHPIAVVLAAGGSTRMGQPKALLRYGGDTLLGHHIAAMRGAGCAVRVVVGGHAARVAPVVAAAGALAVHNRRWAHSGPTDSLRAGLAGLPGAGLVLVTPVDVPPAPPRVLAALLSAPGPAVARIDGQDGHPIRVRVGAVHALHPDQTLRDALRDALRVPVGWPDGLRNLNTLAAFRAWRAAADARG